MSELHFTIGLARCGKSTFCDEWIKLGKRRVIVCADNIRLALHGKRFEAKAEPMVHAIKDVMIGSLLCRGHDVIVDGTHTSKFHILDMFKKHHTVIPHYIHTSSDECKKRAINTKQKDLIPIIDKMELGLKEWLPIPADIILAYQLLEEMQNSVKSNK